MSIKNQFMYVNWFIFVYRRPQGNRYRFREQVDDLEDDYEVPRTPAKQPKSNDRQKSAVPYSNPSDRIPLDEINGPADDRPIGRPFRKDKHRIVEEPDDSQDASYISRRFSGRRRGNEKRVSQDKISDIEQSEDVQQEVKARTTPHPPEEFITPRSSSQAVYARPRVPPRIARPVPVNEKTKYQYPVQKTATTPAPRALQEGDADELIDDYYEDGDYDYGAARSTSSAFSRRRRIQDSVDTVEKHVPIVESGRKRFRNEPRPKIQRVRDQKKTSPAPVYDDYDSEEIDDIPRPPPKAYSSRRHGSNYPQTALDTVENPVVKNKAIKQKGSSLNLRGQRREIEENINKSVKNIPRKQESEPIDEVVEEEEPFQSNVNQNYRRPVTHELERDVEDKVGQGVLDKKNVTPVRVVKRPFLPSRGGSPYLPRGLQVVGLAPRRQGNNLQRDSVDLDPNTRVIQNSALLSRHIHSNFSQQIINSPQRKLSSNLTPNISQNNDDNDDELEEDEEHNEQFEKSYEREEDFGGEQFEEEAQEQQHEEKLVKKERQEQLAHNEKAQLALDMFYENDYDVTINDALNPTLKPLTQALPFQQHQPHHRKQRSSGSSVFSLNSYPVNFYNNMKTTFSASASSAISSKFPTSYNSSAVAVASSSNHLAMNQYHQT